MPTTGSGMVWNACLGTTLTAWKRGSMRGCTGTLKTRRTRYGGGGGDGVCFLLLRKVGIVVNVFVLFITISACCLCAELVVVVCVGDTLLLGGWLVVWH